MLKFVKMEGIGNDYIYFDGINQNIPTNKEFIQNISNRHKGIGSDGMIVVLKSDIADFKMRMFNLDGSEGKMCGNGIRCFAKFVYDYHMTDKTYLEIETLAGIKKVWLDVVENQVHSITVDMGIPSTYTNDIPCIIDKESVINEEIKVHNNIYKVSLVSMGNPHAVMYVDDLEADISIIGKQFEHSSLFPESINTEFVKVIDRKHLAMRVWERGSGETMACGTGACAVMYASYLNGLCDKEVEVSLLGGKLNIEYRDSHIYMSGPARVCFEGYFEEEYYFGESY